MEPHTPVNGIDIDTKGKLREMSAAPLVEALKAQDETIVSKNVVFQGFTGRDHSRWARRTTMGKVADADDVLPGEHTEDAAGLAGRLAKRGRQQRQQASGPGSIT